MSTAKTWETMEPRARDAWIAEHVMGWKPCFIGSFCGPIEQWPDGSFDLPRFTVAAAADYIVLLHIQESWSTDNFRRFSYALADLHMKNGTDLNFGGYGGVCYSPGDYSKAAYLTLTEPAR